MITGDWCIAKMAVRGMGDQIAAHLQTIEGEDSSDCRFLLPHDPAMFWIFVANFASASCITAMIGEHVSFIDHPLGLPVTQVHQIALRFARLVHCSEPLQSELCPAVAALSDSDTTGPLISRCSVRRLSSKISNRVERHNCSTVLQVSDDQRRSQPIGVLRPDSGFTLNSVYSRAVILLDIEGFRESITQFDTFDSANRLFAIWHFADTRRAICHLMQLTAALGSSENFVKISRFPL
jgi:hypothetical protein